MPADPFGGRRNNLCRRAARVGTSGRLKRCVHGQMRHVHEKGAASMLSHKRYRALVYQIGEIAFLSDVIQPIAKGIRSVDIGVSIIVAMAQQLAEVLARLQAEGEEKAMALARSYFPFTSRTASRRKQMSRKMQVQIFERDRYRCRYFGDRLVFPGILLLLEKELQECFPAHQNFRVAESHPIYWWLSPVVDHVASIASGIENPDDVSNLVTTSAFRNTQKMHWSMEDMGWKVRDVPSNDETWDGLVAWFKDYMCSASPDTWKHRSLCAWSAAIGLKPPQSMNL